MNELTLSDAKEMQRLAKAARRPYESDWFLNLAFLQGEQWVAYGSAGLWKPKMRPGAIQLTDNRIQPIVRTEVARLTKARPGWAATPETSDNGAAASARAYTRLLDHAYDKLGFAERRREVTTWSRTCGAGFIKTVWNPNVGEGTEVYYNAATGEPLERNGRLMKADEFPELDGVEGAERRPIGKGEVEFTVRSPFDIYPDPLATGMDDLRFLFDESVRSPEYVRERYGKDVQPDAPAQVGIVETGLTGLTGGGEHVGVRVWELWMPPTSARPEGLHMVFTDTEVLAQGPNEYGRIPYTMFPGIDIPGRFWPDAVVTQLRPIQARWNKMLSQVAENLNKFGNPSLLVDKLAGVKYTGVPGEKIEHNAGAGQRAPVEFLQPPSMPGYGFNFMQQMENSFREISGQYEVAQGTVPAGVTAASAISLLQEQDATRLGPDVEMLEIALGKVGQQAADLFAKYYTTSRIITIVGEDGVADVSEFRSDGKSPAPRITVQPFSTFPRSIAAKQAATRDYLNMLFQYGVPVDANALAKVLRDTDIGGLDNLVATVVADVAQAQREHVELMRGGKLAVGPVDNDAAHVAEHEAFAKTERYRELPPNLQQELLSHIASHKLEAVKKTQEDQMFAAIAGGQMIQGAPQNVVQTQPSGNPLPQVDGPPPGDPSAP